MDIVLILDDMGVQLVEHHHLDEIIYGPLDFLVFGHQEVVEIADMVLLNLHELVQRHGFRVIREKD